jgi:hypothetical protein
MDFEEVRWGTDWLDLDYDRDGWRAFVNAIMNLKASIQCGEFLEWLRNYQLFRKRLAACRQLHNAACSS